MGLQILPVAQRALSELQQGSVCGNVVDCKNYEIGILPAQNIVYVLAKNFSSTLLATIIGIEPKTYKCRVLEGDEHDSVCKRLLESRLVFFSGVCLRIGVQIELDGSATVHIEHRSDAPKAFFKVKK